MTDGHALGLDVFGFALRGRTDLRGGEVAAVDVPHGGIVLLGVVDVRTGKSRHLSQSFTGEGETQERRLEAHRRGDQRAKGTGTSA